MDKYCGQIGFDEARDGLLKAREDYHTAQHGIGKVRALDLNELRLKSAASVAFEGGILEKKRRHLRLENQIVAWSVAMDTILLAA